MNVSEYVQAMDALLDSDEPRVCSYCDEATDHAFCDSCGEYSGLISIAQWEDINGEVWED